MPSPAESRAGENSPRSSVSGSSAEPARSSFPGRALKWIAGGVVGLVALLGVAPQLVAWSPLRHETPRLRLRGFEGKIRVGHASLSWWSPIVLSDMELYAPDGEPFIHISEYREQRSVFQLLFRRNDPSHLRVEAPVVSLKLRPDGSNVEDAMRPVLEQQKRRPTKERSVEVVNGTLTAIDTATGRSAEWKEITLNVHSSPSGAEPNEFHLSTRLAGADEAGPLKVDVSWFSADDPSKPADQPPRTISVTTADLPLQFLDPLLARTIPDLELSGTLTTDLNVAISDRVGSSTARTVQINGRVATRELAAVSPSRLGTDRFSVQSIDLEGKVSTDGAVARVDRLELKTDLGRLSASGRFNLPKDASSQGTSAVASTLEKSDFSLEGDLDLVRLANLLPETLRLREGMVLNEGRVTLNVSSRSENEHPRWRGQLETTRLAATVGVERFAWEQPIRLSFEVHGEPGRLAIDSLRCESDVIELAGHGTSDDAKISGRCDLEQILGRLGQFVDVSDRELKGQLSLESEWKRTAEGPIVVVVQTAVDDFAAGLGGGPLWREPRLVSRLTGRFADEALRPVEVEALELTLTTGAETNDLTAQLVGPVKWNDAEARWDWSVQVAGDLAQWTSRLKSIGVAKDAKLAGQIQSISKISFGRDEVAINELTVDLKSLEASAHGVDLREPEAHLTATGRWNRNDRRLSLSTLELTGTAGAARGREIALTFSKDTLPDLLGDLEIHTDLDRWNPQDAPADQRNWAGKIDAEIRFAGKGEQSLGEWKVDVTDLAIRRQVTKMVERRRGEVESIDLGPPAGPPPRQNPGVPIDRKARRAMERAERDARREAKRQQREARKRAEEIVLVPETAWKTVWEDSRLSLSGKIRFDRQRDAVSLTDLDTTTDGVHVTANAEITEASTRALIDLNGEVNCNLDRILSRLKQSIGEHVHVTGNEKLTFALNGPLWLGTGGSDSAVATKVASRLETASGVRPVAHEGSTARGPLVPLELKGTVYGGWHNADLFGLRAGPATLDLRLAEGVVTMQPLEMTLSDGKLHLGPQVYLTGSPALLVMPAGPVVENVALSQDVCDTWLKFIAPILSEATRVEGKFSLDLTETRLPLTDPASGAMSGRVYIASALVLPGPLFSEIAGVIAEIEAAVRLGNGDLLGLDKPLVKIDGQQVNFKLQDRRLYSSPLAFNVRNIPVRTRGSVGADETLDMIAEIQLPSDWVRRVPVLSQLEGKAMEVPIKGTLRHPKIDASGIGRFWEQFGQEALDSLLNGGLQGILNR